MSVEISPQHPDKNSIEQERGGERENEKNRKEMMQPGPTFCLSLLMGDVGVNLQISENKQRPKIRQRTGEREGEWRVLLWDHLPLSRGV